MDANQSLNPALVSEWFEHEPKFSVAFQSLISLSSGQIVGYEVLTRPFTLAGHLLPVEEFFEVATSLGYAVDLDRLIVGRAMGLARDLELSVPIFINVHPDSLRDPFVQQYLFPRVDGRIVVEITERGNWSGEAMQPYVHDYQNLGGAIALDDFGAGYSGLQKLVMVHPNYVKIDRGLIDGCDLSAVKRNLISSVEHIAKFLGFALIAEGIETYDEMVTCMSLGVDIGQGFYFSRPTTWEARALPDPTLVEDVAAIRTQAVLAEGAGPNIDPFRSQFASLMEHLGTRLVTPIEQLNLILTALYKILKPYSLTLYMAKARGFTPIASRGHNLRQEIPIEMPSTLRQCFYEAKPQVIQHFSKIPAILGEGWGQSFPIPESLATMPIGRPVWGILVADYLNSSHWTDSRLQVFQGLSELMGLLVNADSLGS